MTDESRVLILSRLEGMTETCPSELSDSSELVEERGDMAPRKSTNIGTRLWDKVRQTLLRPKVNSGISGLLKYVMCH